MKRNKKSILCVGVYAIKSAGDDAPLLTLKSIMDTRFKGGLDWHVLSRHVDKHFDEHYGVTTHRNLEYPTKEQSVQKWFRGFNVDDNPEILIEQFRIFESADLIVLGAGNFLNENSFGLFRGFLSASCVSAFMAKAARKPFMLYGLSATDLETRLARSMASWLLNSADVVTFRESLSPKVLLASKVTLPKRYYILPDPVFGSPSSSNETAAEIFEVEGIPRCRKRLRLGLAVREFLYRGKGFHQNFIKRITKVVQKWVAAGGEVVFIPQFTYDQAGMLDDRITAQTILRGISNPENCYSIKGQYWPEDVESLYSQCDVVMGVRLHGSVFGLKQGVPTLGLAYEPKVQGMFESLNLGQNVLPLDSSPETIVAALNNISRTFEKRSVAVRIARLKEQLKKYGDLAEQLLIKHRN